MVSPFSDVDGTDPDRLRASLLRRADAVLYRPYREHLHRLIAASSGLVCDVGAGVGSLVREISSTRQVVGVEPSVELTREALRAGRPVVLGSGTQLPFPDASVGCVVLERVLQHVSELERVLLECARVLAPGGRLIAVDPVHAEVELVVPQELQQVARETCRWRARRGLASPDAAARTGAWAHTRSLSMSVQRFVCRTSVYADARAVVNFPEWSRLAVEDGETLSTEQVESWEAFFDPAPAPDQFEMTWPIAVTCIDFGS